METKRRKKHRWWFAPLAFSIATVAALLVCEVVLRVYVTSRGWTANCYITGDAFFVPDPFSGHTLRPNLRLRSSTYDITVNSLGMRGPEIAVEKPAGIKRIAILGASSVFGYLVPDGEDSCRVLEELLVERGQECQVINAGVPGFNMQQVTARFNWQVTPLQPDIVIVYLGWNDIVSLISEDPYAERFLVRPAPSLATRIMIHSTLYGLLRYRLFPPSAARFVPKGDQRSITPAGAAAFRERLETLLETTERSGAAVIVCTQVMAAHPEAPQELSNYLGDNEEQIKLTREIGPWVSEELQTIAKNHQLHFIDAKIEIPPDATVLGDAIHLTRKGHEQLAELWCDELLQHELRNEPSSPLDPAATDTKPIQ
jgi:lysophospholipase L1-like esterase